MDVLKTIVGKHLNNMFLENVALNVARFLEMTRKEKREYEDRVDFCNSLEAYLLKRNHMAKFEKYQKNLRYTYDGVYSYGTRVIELDWRKQTAKRLGRWSNTTSRHQNYALKELAMEWGFKEITG